MPASGRGRERLVAAGELALETASFAFTIALPGALWAILFLLAWSHGPFAESLGIGRKAFWLLVPGALLTSLAFLPITPVSYDWLALGVSGALLPLLVGGVALGRYARPHGHWLGVFLVLLAAMAAALFVVVLPSTAAALARADATARLPSGSVELVSVAVIATVFAAGFGAYALRSTDRSARATAFLYGIVAMVLVLTFAGSSAVPGVGIEETFPYYLLPPLLAGAAAGLFAPRVFPKEEGFAIPVAYFGATFGVLLGADLLREPPLYGHGAAGLYTIGGAGIFDLVYLSGLLALAVAYVTHVAMARPWDPVGEPLPASEPTPVGYLERAFRSGVDGRLEDSLVESARATHDAAAQARRLLEVGGPVDDAPWRGLPVPGWVVSDQANLDAVARSKTTDAREAYRAWLTARQLVLLGREIGVRRFASVPQRVVAFAIDLLLVGGVGSAVFALIAFRTPGGFGAVASSLAFNAAIYGFVAVALFYFVLAEAWTGTTVGKAAVGIWVRDRHLGPLDRMAALVRNAPNAPILVLVGFGSAIATAIAVKGLPGVQAYVRGFGLPVGDIAIIGVVAVVVGAIGLLGGLAVLVILITWERQRIGDLWAGTWVVRRPTPRPPAPADSPPESVGAGRSG